MHCCFLFINEFSYLFSIPFTGFFSAATTPSPKFCCVARSPPSWLGHARRHRQVERVLTVIAAVQRRRRSLASHASKLRRPDPAWCVAGFARHEPARAATARDLFFSTRAQPQTITVTVLRLSSHRSALHQRSRRPARRWAAKSQRIRCRRARRRALGCTVVAAGTRSHCPCGCRRRVRLPPASSSPAR